MNARLLKQSTRFRTRRPSLGDDDRPGIEAVRVLESDAVILVRMLQAMPSWWSSRPFSVHVETIRAQLAPINSVEALGSSRSRESHARPGSTCASRASADRLADCPVEIAYAIRWIELTSGACPSWTDLVGDPIEHRVPGMSEVLAAAV